jgi:NitT/TauT family transport system substrate-binding protein
MKRHTFAARTLTALVALHALPARAAAPFRLIITETETPLVPNSVQEFALTLGYYKRAGVDVELVRVQQTPSAIAALRSGQGDMANIAVATAVELVARDQMKLRAVLSPDKSLPFLIAAKKTVMRPKDLEGKVFGVARVGSVDYELARLALGRLGVAVDKIQYLAVGQPPVRAQALAAGQLDATAVSIGVWLAVPDKTGLTVLLDQSAFFRAAPFISKVSVVTTDTAAAKGPQIESVVRGIIAASRDFAREPKRWVDAMVAARPDVKRADLEVLATTYRQAWSVNGGLNVKNIAFTTDTVYRDPEFDGLRHVAASEWVDTSFIDTALKSVGVDRAFDARD